MTDKKMPRELSDFGMFLKIELVKKGITQEDFAKQLGMTASYFSNLLYKGKGTRSGTKYLPEIAEKLDVDIGQLYKLLIKSKKSA